MLMSSPQLNAIAQLSAERIVDCMIEGTLVALFASLVISVARRQSSDTRFAVWFSALISIAALPVIGGAWPAGGISAPVSRPPITVPASWALYLFAAWAAVAGWSLIAVARGLWYLHVLRKSCVPVDVSVLDPQLQKILARNQESRTVTLCTSDRVRVPTAIGFVKPAIVIPGWVMQGLSSDELNQIVLHELAHLRRWDDWTNLAQKLVRAVLFFHPAVWWIEKRVSLQREMACDDAVLAETSSPRAYAECLAHLAEMTLIQRSIALAQAAVGQIRQTSLRVAQILDVNRPKGSASAWKPAILLMAGFAVASALVISKAPKLVTFDGVETGKTAAPMIASISPGAESGRASTVTFNPTTELHSQAVRFAQATLNVSAIEHGPRVQPPASERRTRDIAPQIDARQISARQMNARQTNANWRSTNATPVAFTETLFVIVGGRGYDGSDVGSSVQPVYQIQLWRVVILHPVVDPGSNRLPSKQT